MNEYFDWINNKIRKSVETTASFETLDYPDVVVTEHEAAFMSGLTYEGRTYSNKGDHQ